MIQVYTGNGKGKTTAALGLALRAVGAGLNVYIAQFMKSGTFSEIKSIKKIPKIKVEQFGGNRYKENKVKEADIKQAVKGYHRVKEIIAKGNFDVVILDEINVAICLKLLELHKVLELIKSAPKNLELVLTGRWANPKIIKQAGLVSEIKEIRHYYRKGIKARKGIEY